ncbi:DUF2304 domain-containing protein [Arthrobacter agilis]|uniref:DUF2304 domain-containing protein n=1 Tax=Arthrobacter agilis TaxID=37921 RepID=UPI0027800BA8|nr:DUF2304 domain-containing protein [Arthrobacter agilis]MDQ0735511.1 hypothetical protein [Arthrobacter agilis]
METIAAFVLAIIIVAVVLDLLRRKKIREKYAALWLIVGAATVVLGAFPQLLAIAAETVGVTIPSNLLFALGILFVLGVLLHLSVEISSVEDETRALAEEVAILRAQLEALAADRTVPSEKGPADAVRAPMEPHASGHGSTGANGASPVHPPQKQKHP